MTWREIVEKLYELEKTHPGLSRRTALVNAGIDGRDPLKITGLITAIECECNSDEIPDNEIVLDTQNY
jgi:hypothetical protein